MCRRQHRLHRFGKVRSSSAVSKESRDVRTPCVGDLGGLYLTLQVVLTRSPKERRFLNLMMNRVKQSDAAIVLLNAANKEARVSAESNEGRAATKGNLRSQSTCRTQRRESESQAAERIRQAVFSVCRHDLR